MPASGLVSQVAGIHETVRHTQIMGSSGYDSEMIDWLRPPDVEGEQGRWASRWLLDLSNVPRHFPPYQPPADLSSELISLELITLPGQRVVLELRSTNHPRDPEGYLLINSVLRWVDTEFGLIAINDAERDRWRTFRDAGPTGDG